MGDTNEYTVHDLVRDELYKNMDVEYGKFIASLSPGAGNIIGVRIPVLRKMAKEIASFISWTTSKNFRIPDGWIVVIVLFNGSLILHLYPFIFGLLCHYGSMILILLQNEVGLRAEHGIQRGKLIGHEL